MSQKYMNILLVDNDELSLQAYTIALEPGNFRCITSTDPETAIGLYRELINTQNKIDVVITDFLLPGISGLELMRKVKEFDNTARVIIVTEFPDSLILKNDSVSNAYAIFPKPLHLPSLISVLQKIESELKGDSGV